MENSSLDLVHGAAIYQKDNFSVDSINNITGEEFLKLVLGPQRQDDKVGFCYVEMIVRGRLTSLYIKPARQTGPGSFIIQFDVLGNILIALFHF